MHTKLPWKLDKFGSPKSGRKDVILSGFGVACGAPNPEAIDNTALVLRAVNTEAKMRSALTLVLTGLRNGSVKSKPLLSFGNPKAESLELESLVDIVEAALK